MSALWKEVDVFAQECIDDAKLAMEREESVIQYTMRLRALAADLLAGTDLPAPGVVSLKGSTIVPEFLCTWNPCDFVYEDDDDCEDDCTEQVELAITLHGCYVGIRKNGVFGPTRFFDDKAALIAELRRELGRLAELAED
jgi:hypothetical protein